MKDVYRATIIAIIVGSILIVINQIDLILTGQLTGIIIFKMALTPVVPFCVSLLSAKLAASSHKASLGGNIDKDLEVIRGLVDQIKTKSETVCSSSQAINGNFIICQKFMERIGCLKRNNEFEKVVNPRVLSDFEIAINSLFESNSIYQREAEQLKFLVNSFLVKIDNLDGKEAKAYESIG